jgi:hypothetical protein
MEAERLASEVQLARVKNLLSADLSRSPL